MRCVQFHSGVGGEVGDDHPLPELLVGRHCTFLSSNFYSAEFCAKTPRVSNLGDSNASSLPVLVCEVTVEKTIPSLHVAIFFRSLPVIHGCHRSVCVPSSKGRPPPPIIATVSGRKSDGTFPSMADAKLLYPSVFLPSLVADTHRGALVLSLVSIGNSPLWAEIGRQVKLAALTATQLFSVFLFVRPQTKESVVSGVHASLEADHFYFGKRLPAPPVSIWHVAIYLCPSWVFIFLIPLPNPEFTKSGGECSLDNLYIGGKWRERGGSTNLISDR